MDQSRGARSTPRRAPLRSDLTLLAVVGVVLLAALTAGGASVYREFYSPSAFVTHYLTLLSEGRAADALRLPGVAIEHSELELSTFRSASDALLRRAALAPLTEISVAGERPDGDATDVTVHYRAGGHPGTSTFKVRQGGWIGVAPSWAFAQSPLSVVSITIRGSDQFSVNGFSLDRRQVAAKGAESSPLDPVPMLVFSPGLYTVSVKTATATASGVGVLADKPLADVPLDVQTHPTAAFIKVVQDRVDEFLTQCATQKVLQPTGCPFGMTVQNRVIGDPSWRMATMPVIALEPSGAGWRIPPTPATAHIQVRVQSLFDGTIRRLDEDVPFHVDGTIQFLPDGSASISITSPDQPTAGS
ncbi:hypothetical protein [Microbacterium capsulatum]|uniref:Uncharacterized protein n=1 Tax=Microbacterium capsulatum TaxID=3041921 RepID=A0ABU0XII5_9MICO|nr:hypothetical protein [Microbacterium sp. ASV81]MDQ4214911.1 hypothetical protein [Microbacterium sp. ASV81]